MPKTVAIPLDPAIVAFRAGQGANRKAIDDVRADLVWLTAA